MENTVTIDQDRYKQLLRIEAKMKQLEINGVDNWAHYGCMCYENGEKECIFFVQKIKTNFLK